MPSNRPTASTMDDWMRDQERRTASLERRGSIRNAAQILGPGFGPKATAVTDWNSSVTVFNGYFYSEIGAPNSPDPFRPWVGQSTIDQTGNGWQTITSRDNFGYAYRRRVITTLGGSPTFSAWQETLVKSFWQPLPYMPNYQDYGAPWQGGRYQRINDEVSVEGLVTRNTANAPAGSTCAILPVGYRPPGGLIFKTEITGAVGRLDVNPDGTIVHQDQILVVGGYLSLSVIKFSRV